MVTKKLDRFFLIGEDNFLNVINDDSSWIVDSSASFHVTPYQELFSPYQGGDFGIVKMENHIASKIMGMGNVILATNMGCEFVLKDVRHNPHMRLNLISIRKLDDFRYVNSFGARKWKLTRSSIIVAR
ncbi:UNVERIFIED_CONTAM: Retrovirus-related Pol polyprotein from transposon TNT 1-94 [Sesamum radiatum]|uniref:Retrovirus-related Pol polyprotein from transposon TNT 1-94 n=1 Tax=Sesamum radiatum TaxID=300843 RepID=A0AAW2KBJ4_SESRA